MRDWPVASAHGAAGCTPIADVALQPERFAGRFSHSSSVSRRRWPTPFDRIVFMRCPSNADESAMLVVLRVALGILVVIGAIAAVVASLGFDLIPSPITASPAVCDGSDPSNVSAEVATVSDLNSSDVTDASVLSVATPPAEQEQPIATFEEWTKEKLLKQDQHKIANGHQYHHAHPQTATTDSVDGSGASPGETKGGPLPSPPAVAVLIDVRNYASKECGAKVLLGNPEAENRGAILNEKERDEYMRNPCDQARSKFFIVELCETIQPTKMELANFELFSSGPKEVRVSGSERYPTTDWTPLGEFVAQDSRSIQSFPVLGSRTYTKFLKFELLSHYGKEHYCTLSLVRVFGISMVDEYEIEANFIEHGTQPRIIAHSTETVQSVDNNETNEAPPAEFKKNIVGTVKEAVVNITKGVIDTGLAFVGIRSASQSDKAQHGFTGRLFAVRRAECRSCPIDQPLSKCTNFCYMFNPMKRRPSEPQPTAVDQPAPTSSQSVVLPTASEAVVASNPRVVPPVADSTGKETRRRRPDSRAAFLALLRRYMNEAPSVQSTKPVTVTRTTTATPVVLPPTPPPTQMPMPVPVVLTPPVSMPGGSTNHKESVFIKLNNRIRALEMNISLSSQYLSELSRQYVSQMDEIRRQYERTSKTANDTNRAAEDAKHELTARIEKLQTAIDDLDAKIASSVQPVPLEDIDSDSNDMDGTEVAPLLPAHMLNDGKRWTTEEVLLFVVIAQLLTTTLVLLVSRCCRRRAAVMDATTVRQLVDEQLLVRNVQLSPAVIDQSAATPPGVDRFVFGDAVNAATVVKAKKKRKKSKKLSSTTGTGDTWDSAMESTTSVRSTGTPTPSELSSEIDLPSSAPIFLPSDRDSTPRGDVYLPLPVAPDPWIVQPCRKSSSSSLPSIRKKRPYGLLANRNMFRVLQTPLKRKHQI